MVLEAVSMPVSGAMRKAHAPWMGQAGEAQRLRFFEHCYGHAVLASNGSSAFMKRGGERQRNPMLLVIQ